MASRWPPYRHGIGHQQRQWEVQCYTLSVNPSPASLQGTDYPGECAPCQLNSDIHVASTILLLLWAARSLRKTSTPCRGLLLWEYSSPMGGGWSSSQSTESSSVSTTMWHSRSPFLAQPTMMGKISSSR